jgi:hypothetical protein
MLEHLFGSKTRADMLRIFFRDPDKSLYVRELTRLLDTQINAIRREIDTLVSLQLIEEKDADLTPSLAAGEAGASLRKYYTVNKNHIIYNELRALILRSQLVDEQALLKELREKGGTIDLLLITGTFTADKQAPVDMLIVGNVKPQRVAKSIENYETRFGSPIRYTTMTRQEFLDRRSMMDKFLFSIFEAEHIFIVKELDV